MADPWTWVSVGLALIVATFGYSLCVRGIVLSDEGYLLLESLDMLHGKVLYRDMDAFVAPGAWFAIAGLFALVEPSVWATRMLALAGYCATVLVSYRIVRRLCGRAWGVGAVFGPWETRVEEDVDLVSAGVGGSGFWALHEGTPGKVHPETVRKGRSDGAASASAASA